MSPCYVLEIRYKTVIDITFFGNADLLFNDTDIPLSRLMSEVDQFVWAQSECNFSQNLVYYDSFSCLILNLYYKQEKDADWMEMELCTCPPSLTSLNVLSILHKS